MSYLKIQTLEEENLKLRDRISFLEEENLVLKSKLLPRDWYPPRILGLSRNESIVLATIYNSDDIPSDDLIYDALYGTRPDGDIPDGNVLQVFISRIKKKLFHHSVKIERMRCVGYYIPESSKRILEAIKDYD